MAAKARRTGGGSGLLLQGMICGAVLTFATPAAFLASVLLAPTLLALIFESGPPRKMTRAVALSASAFAYAPLWHLWLQGASMGTAATMMLDPEVICPAWMAGAFAWGLCEILPVLLRITSDIQANAKLTLLRKEAAELRQAWDLTK